MCVEGERTSEKTPRQTLADILVYSIPSTLLHIANSRSARAQKTNEEDLRAQENYPIVMNLDVDDLKREYQAHIHSHLQMREKLIEKNNLSSKVELFLIISVVHSDKQLLLFDLIINEKTINSFEGKANPPFICI